VYVTAQYDSPPAHKMVYGAFDRKRDEALLFYRVDGGKGFIAYYDLPVGRAYPDEAAVLARYDALAGQLQLGTPVSPPQVFDAMQHVSRSASHGRILKIGDSAGNADPYIGAGVAAALIDSKKAVAALTAPGDVVANIRGAADGVLAGHKALGWQAEILREGRPLAMRTLPSASLDESFRASDMRVSIPLELSARAITKLPVPGA
jgi:2-polyprenyl-6-methoxyphenol hydroxylase-like FAD-dependent oxidoreductase